MKKTDIQLKNYNSIVFFTGAGLSVESGIPTYRGKGGTWEKYNYKEYACQKAFDSDPEKVWEFHDRRRAFMKACEPSLGHIIIADIEKSKPETVVITQNIDGLHQKAGSKNVVELHGSIWRIRCDKEGIVKEDYSVPLRSRRCSCGAYWRPDIVWFEDPMKIGEIDRAIQAIRRCDIFISIGTSGVVYPAAQLPLLAMEKGIPTIEINPERTPMTRYYHYHLEGSASEMLRKLWIDPHL